MECWSFTRYLNINKKERALTSHVQGDHGGQILRFVDLIFEVPQSCPTAMPFLPNSQQPKQKWAISGTTKVKSAKPNL